MRNYVDGGEAIVEALRKLSRLHHVVAGFGMVAGVGGTDAAKDSKNAGADLHRILARDARRKHGERILADDRPTAGSAAACRRRSPAGQHGHHGALQAEIPMIVMSGELQSLGEDPNLDIEPQWYGGLTRW